MYLYFNNFVEMILHRNTVRIPYNNDVSFLELLFILYCDARNVMTRFDQTYFTSHCCIKRKKNLLQTSPIYRSKLVNK